MSSFGFFHHRYAVANNRQGEVIHSKNGTDARFARCVYLLFCTSKGANMVIIPYLPYIFKTLFHC